MAKNWCYTAEASERLELTAKKLSQLRRRRALKRGHHYRDVASPGAARSTYQYHVGRIEALLREPPEKRKRYA